MAEWIDGVRLSDKCGIAHLMGDNRTSASSTGPLAADRFPSLRGGAKWVMQTMIDLFSAQIFNWGWVRCCPHPGNVIVRPHSDPRRAACGVAQLVLLDHRLYVRLPREFQQQYARLWKALLTVDFAAVSAVAGEWGIGAPDLFASAMLMRPIRFAEQAPLPDFERMNDYERGVVMKAKQADVDRNIFCLQRRARVCRGRALCLGRGWGAEQAKLAATRSTDSGWTGGAYREYTGDSEGAGTWRGAWGQGSNRLQVRKLRFDMQIVSYCIVSYSYCTGSTSQARATDTTWYRVETSPRGSPHSNTSRELHTGPNRAIRRALGRTVLGVPCPHRVVASIARKSRRGRRRAHGSHLHPALPLALLPGVLACRNRART